MSDTYSDACLVDTSKIGLNGQCMNFSAELSFAPSSFKPTAILGIIAVGTY